MSEWGIYSDKGLADASGELEQELARTDLDRVTRRRSVRALSEVEREQDRREDAGR